MYLKNFKLILFINFAIILFGCNSSDIKNSNKSNEDNFEISIDTVTSNVTIKEIDFSEKYTLIKGVTKYAGKTIMVYNSEWEGSYRDYHLTPNDKIKIEVEIIKQIEKNKIRFLGRANFQKYLKSELSENGLEIQNIDNEESLSSEEEVESQNESFNENENEEIESYVSPSKETKYNNEKINSEVVEKKIKEKIKSPISRTHIVKQGESINGIAQRYEVKVNDLRKLNNIDEDYRLTIGQVLIIPN
jgi:LysM repeat protein